jgi:4-aminobutyrate aminotransferase-like enzyme/Ser/Thr protein kinase RdoA (MazF antagonist)
VRDAYGLSASVLSELPSERDQNFHLRDGSGRELVLKIASSAESPEVIDFQNQALAWIAARDAAIPIPRLCGATTEESSFLCRLFERLPGKPLARVRPHSERLLRSIGRTMAGLDRALEGFTHPAQGRFLKWNATNAREVVGGALDLVPAGERREVLTHFFRMIEQQVAPRFAALPRGVIHNDANDYNLLVIDQDVSGILDFGDMVESALICELANACAYVMLDKSDPLRAARAVAAGYHQVRPLAPGEIEALFPLIVTRLAMSVAISARQFRDEPEKEYLRVSERPAWELLFRLREESERLAHYGFRWACGLPPHPRAAAVAAHLVSLSPGEVLPRSGPLRIFDLSVGAPAIETTEELFREMAREGARIGVGRYDEARLLYTTDAFRTKNGEARTLHLGIDLFVEPGTPIRAPLEGRVHSFAVNEAPLDYGPTILLEHDTGDGDRFFTLYGHLSLDSLQGLVRGKPVSRGETIARVGAYEVNGNWPPHLHFQIVLDLLDKEGDFPGVAAPSERELWLGLSPDPSRILGLPKEARAPREDALELRRRRQGHLSPNLSLSYEQPLHIVRGSGVHLFDAEGRSYLDMVNNVCHVGHAHPRVVRAIARQASVLNTNTRYLHANVVELAERLVSLLPPPLEVVFFVNSGSEANDLALRLARTRTGRRETLVLGGAYHGNLTSLIELSPYKYRGPGGEGAPSHVIELDMPDGYRGRYRRTDRAYGERYLADAIAAVRAKPVGAVIAEGILSCGGQIVLPPGYLAGLFRAVREAGGVAIADEVQAGFGRVGAHFWAFAAEGALPDIVTMGKPFGNGHPLAAVATTLPVARAFQTGMEYFNTFGGNPVSCAAGLAVLDVLAEERLPENARLQGELLLAELLSLKARHPILGDVRGRGLFLGFELVRDRETLEPATAEARALVNRMKEEGVLLSTDGPLANVIKIKPPLVFSRGDADRFLSRLDFVLGEDRFRI